MTTAPEVTGVREALRTLRQIDPEMRKQFNSDAQEIVRPAIGNAQGNYSNLRLPSGFSRRWAPNGRVLFPASQTRMANKVKFKTDLRQKAKSIFKIVNQDAAATIIEFAGVSTSNRMAASLYKKNQLSVPRVLWPSVDTYLPQIRNNLEKSIKSVEDHLNRLLN